MKSLAIARLTIRDSIRRMSLVVVAVLWAFSSVVTFVLPSTEAVDRIRMVLSWNLWSASFFTVLLAIFLAAPSIPRDLEQRQVFTVLTKPIRAWDYFFGKFLGFAFLLGAILVAYTVFVIVLVGSLLGDLTPPEQEVHRYARHRAAPDRTQLLEGGAITDIAGGAQRGDFVLDGEGQTALWTFEGLDPEVLPPGPIAGVLRARVHSREGAYHAPFHLSLRNPATGKEAFFEERVAQGRQLPFSFPREMLDGVGDLELRLRGDDRFVYLLEQGEVALDDIRVDYRWNLARAMLVVYMEVVLVLAITLGASTFLGGPVTMLAGLSTYLVGHLLEIVAGFARRLTSTEEAVAVLDLILSRQHLHSAPAAGSWVDEGGALLLVVRGGLEWFARLFPDFGHYAVGRRVSEGLLVEGQFGVDLQRIVGFSWRPWEAGPLSYTICYAGAAILCGWLIFRSTDVERGEGPLRRGGAALKRLLGSLRGRIGGRS